MPRRKVAKKNATRRSSIKVEIDQSVSEAERREKLAAFIADLESEREAKLKSMQDDIDKLLTKVSSLFEVELVKVPSSVRAMPYSEFKSKYDGDVSKAVNMSVLAATQKELKRLQPASTVRRGGKKTVARKQPKAPMFETIREDEAAPGDSRPYGKTPAMMAPPTGAMGRVLRTSSRAPKQWADTPLVTPAFHPRLARTKQRKPERCTFVFDDANSPKIEIPVNGEMLSFSKDSELTHESKEVLESISKMISAMLKGK